MPHGHRGGRITPGFAGIVLMVVWTAGCGQLPIQPFAPETSAEPLTPETVFSSGPPVATPEARVELDAVPGPPATDEPLVGLPGSTPEAAPVDSALARVGDLPASSVEPASATAEPVTPKPAPEPPSLAEGEAQDGPTTPPLATSDPTAVPDPQASAADPPADPVPPTPSVETEIHEEASPPRDAWRDGIETLRAVIRSHDESDGPWRLRALLLDALARAGEDGGGDANLWKTVLPALGATDEPPMPTEGPRGDELRAAILALEDQAPFEINDLRLCRKVGGFGDFDPLDANALRAGQRVILYCELSGLRYEAHGEGFRSRLASSYEVVPASGGEPVVRRTSLGAADDFCRRRRRDYYANYRVDLPRGLPPGSYELRLWQEDSIAGHSTSSSIAFSILP